MEEFAAICVFVLFISSSVVLSASSDVPEYVESLFKVFIKAYSRSYAVGSEEYFIRLRAFEANVRLNEKLNSFRDHPDSALYGTTKFFDMTEDEFREKYLSGFKSDIKFALPFEAAYSRGVPPKFDWRRFGIITEPRDQKGCGSCWAFAAVETIESMYANKTKELVPLSVQQMVDCSFMYNPMLRGCNGGDTCSAFYWALQTKTVFVPEVKYPYAGKNQPCQMRSEVDKSKGPVVYNYTCNSFVNFESSMLQQIVSVGPLTVAVDASNWRNYQGGVIQFHCGEVPRNHAVQIVGYDLTAPIPYYIVKNSWGSDFGHDGYLYIKYGGNVCSIAEAVSTAQVTV